MTNEFEYRARNSHWSDAIIYMFPLSSIYGVWVMVEGHRSRVIGRGS